MEIDTIRLTTDSFSNVASNHQADFGDLIQAVIREIQARRHWISSEWIDPADIDTNSDMTS
jgi:hypothetical protein